MHGQLSLRFVFAALLALILVGCGGGSGFTEDDNVVVDPGTPVVATVTLLASSPQLSSNASTAASGVTLTAIVRDANQNPVSGAPVLFAADADALVTPPTPAVTDEGGQIQAVLTTAGNPQNRTINVSATSGGVSATASIAVVGTTLAVTGPASTQAGTATEYTASLADSGGIGIAGRTVDITTNPGNTLSATSLTTNSSGVVTFTLSATTASSTVTVSALGLTDTQAVVVSNDSFELTAPTAGALLAINQPQTVTVRWFQGGTAVPDGTMINFSATRGALSASSATTTDGIATVTINSAQAGGSTVTASSSALTMPTATVGAQFVATQAVNLNVQADPAIIATNEFSDISAIVRDAANNLVANKAVEFSLVDSTGGTLSASSALTNNLGVARVTYAASSITSSDNGVRINALVRNASGSPVQAEGAATLTVGARALRILLGTGNEILEPNETVYDLPYSAIVTDSSGNPAPDATFQLSALPHKYLKGYYVSVVIGGVAFWTPVYTASCDNEDGINDGIIDGILQPGEDVNDDESLTPGNVASVPPSPALDPDTGSVQFNIRYPQDRGNWVQLRLRAKAAVAGTETTETAVFIVPISEEDAKVANGAPPATIYSETASGIDANGDGDTNDTFAGSPYGISASCFDTN